MKNAEICVNRPMAKAIWRSFRSCDKRHLLITGTRKSGKSTLYREIIKFIPKQSDSQWASIDETGYPETSYQPYCDEILKLMEQKRVIAVVRKQELLFLKNLINRDDVFLVDLDEPFKTVGCVIMASGLGKRFGCNKLAADFGGEPLIYRVFDSTDGIFVKRVAVTRNPDTYALCKNKNIETVYHSLPYRSDTVRLGIEEVKDNISACMFIPADQPLITKETIQTLIFSAVNAPEYIWQPEFEGVKGSPVVFPKWAFKELENLPQGKGGNVLVKKYPDRVRTIQALNAYELMDVDSQDDLKNLLKFRQFFL